MKKILSLFIATTLSLHSMEQPVTYAFDTLPQDVQVICIECLNQDISPNSIIKSITATSCICLSLHERIYTLYGIGDSSLIKTNILNNAHDKFNKLVHLLANKFNIATGEIVKEVKAPIFQGYFDLFVKLQCAVMCKKPNINQVKELIEKGADVNGSGPGGITPLMQAIPFQNIDLITLLLNNRANPDAKGTDMTMTDCLHVVFDLKKREQITQLLEDARKKLQSTEK